MFIFIILVILSINVDIFIIVNISPINRSILFIFVLLVRLDNSLLKSISLLL